jgi:outer membrane immunogenic protein
MIRSVGELRNFVMRRFLIAVAALCFGQAAQAADLPFLRGSFQDEPIAPRRMWDGFYIGGQVGYGRSDMNFTGATRDVAASLMTNLTMENEFGVSQWPIMGKASQSGTGIGGFAGYNSQWDDTVIGIELSYMHGKFGGAQTDSMGRSFTTSDGYTNGVTYEGNARMSISDIGTIRARAGYAIGAFLPYMFGGVALGQADIVREARIYGRQVNVNAAPGFQQIDFDLNRASAQYSHLIYGYSAGLGVDINLIGGLFARAEWEYIRFTSSVDVNVNTVRAGVGYKF